MKVTVTEDCIACERCVEICPDVFQMGEQYAEPQVNPVPTEYQEASQEAADECPVDAIIVEN